MITIQLTDSEVDAVLIQSPAFRAMFVQRYTEAQKSLAKSIQPTEEQLVNRLTQYVRNNFGFNSKIAGIKYVRQFVSDNKDNFSYHTYNRLYSLSGAKTFVENLICW